MTGIPLGTEFKFSTIICSDVKVFFLNQEYFDVYKNKFFSLNDIINRLLAKFDHFEDFIEDFIKIRSNIDES
jgi:hypothetical protein